LSDVQSEFAGGADLSARDSWSRTAWLLSLQVGDVEKMKLLLSAGADRSDRGHCGKTPIMYAIENSHAEMLRWLISEGFDPNEPDEHGDTPLLQASHAGDVQCARILIDAGARLDYAHNGQNAVNAAENIEVVRLLVERGGDLADISDEMRAVLTRVPDDGVIRVSREEYQAAKYRRFGSSNPEKMNLPFWKSMVSSGASAYTARKQFDDTKIEPNAVWCFRRYGKSITELPDGRIIEIAGEHEDHYDPDFCIYNDVVVHHGDGTFDIYGYPKDVFPPTDFHTATLVGDCIYVIGSLGYFEERRFGDTPVYRVHINTLVIEEVQTSGEKPGWISRHRAIYDGRDTIRICGGKRQAQENGIQRYDDNSSEYILNLDSGVWTRVER